MTADAGRSLNRVVFSLGMSTFGIGVSLTVVALVADDLTSSGVLIGAIVASRWVSRLVFTLPAGAATQRRDPYMVFGIGIVLVAVSGLLSALSTTWPLFLVARLIEGVGAALSMTSGMVMIIRLDAGPRRGRLFSHYHTGQRIGFWLGPVAGGFIAAWGGDRAALWAYAALATFAIVPLLTFRRPVFPSPHGFRQQPFRADVGQLLRNPKFVLVGAVSFVAFFSMTGMQLTALPILVEHDLQLGTEVIGLSIFASNAVSFVLLYPTGWASDRISRRGVVGLLLAVGAVGVLAMAFVHSLAGLLSASALTGAIHALRGPATQAFASDAAGDIGAGATAAVYRMMGDVGSVLGPLTVGWLLAGGTATYFVVNAAIAAAVLCAFLVGTRPIALGTVRADEI